MKILVVMSGGLDSATLACSLTHQGHTVGGFSVNYGQRHKKELYYARMLCRKLEVKHYEIDLRQLGALLPGGSLTDEHVQVPHGHYQEDTMKQTVVPNRNMVLLSLAAAVAIANGYEAVAYGAHAGDHAIYPDCRPEFIRTMCTAFLQCDWNMLFLLTPFAHLTKSQIVQEGIRVGVPFEWTWTCYEGSLRPCLKCGSCTERAEAFREAGIADPALT